MPFRELSRTFFFYHNAPHAPFSPRKVSRGNIQLIRLNERMGYELDVVSSWVDALMDKQGAKPDNQVIEAQKVRVFEVRVCICTLSTSAHAMSHTWCPDQ